jgi:hypothetical protein
MVLSYFRHFFDKKSGQFFIKMTPIPMKYPEKHKIFCKFDPKITKIGRGAAFVAAGFRDFRVEFAKYFVFFGVFHGNPGHFYEKWVRFWRKMSKIEEYHCSLLSTRNYGGKRLCSANVFARQNEGFVLNFSPRWEYIDRMSKVIPWLKPHLLVYSMWRSAHSVRAVCFFEN